MQALFHTPSQTLSSVLWAEKSNQWLRFLTFAIAGSIALTVSAKISIPAIPVPFTLQTLVVLLLGFAYGPAMAGATVGLYLLQGAFGLPVFQGTPEKGLGLAYMMGPTGGYLAGFFVAAVVCGKLAQKGWDKRFSTMALGMILGNAIIYAFGLAWLGSLIGWDQPVLQYGMIPFLVGDLIKIAIAVALVPMIWKRVNRK
ncbi:MAG: biotin transporter BioY [Proteobacteria bacterium]|nr:biotin transporter BioY [Pseudomonadota bacterium]